LRVALRGPLTASLLLAFAFCAAARAASDPFPEPAALRQAVDFWERVYVEVDTGGGLLHDSRHLGVVYEVLDFEGELSPRARRTIVKDAKSRWRALLQALANGRGPHGAGQRAIVDAFTAALGRAPTARDFWLAVDRVRFQLGQRDKFVAGLRRAGAYEPHVRRTLRALGVPGDLAFLPHVESSFNPDAVSKYGAAGMWQFMRSTGRLYMRVDFLLDERLDPLRAAVAAGELLRDNYARLGTWPLAITAYNHGAAGMDRARRKLGTDDIGVICLHYRSRTFGFASRNFYAQFLAARRIGLDPERYFGPIRRERPLAFDTVGLPFYADVSDLEAYLGVSRAAVQRYNPALRPPILSGEKRIPAGYALKLPPGTVADEPARWLAALPAERRHDAQRPSETHVVRRGDTLSAIAAYHGTSVSRLVAINHLSNRHRIFPGQTLYLPASGRRAPAPAPAPAEPVLAAAPAGPEPGAEAAGDVPVAPASGSAPGGGSAPMAGATPAAADRAAPAAAEDAAWTRLEGERAVVAPGETLGHYADWLGVATQRLREVNGLAYGRALRVGQRVRLDYSRVSPGRFLERRVAYHRAIRRRFFDQHRITGTVDHLLRRGESLWVLSSKVYSIPAWLLHRYNPDTDHTRLTPGMRITIPVVERVSSS